MSSQKDDIISFEWWVMSFFCTTELVELWVLNYELWIIPSRWQLIIHKLLCGELVSKSDFKLIEDLRIED